MKKTEDNNNVFYRQLMKLCCEHNEKPTPLLRSLGYSATNLKRWESGSTVNSEILEKLADYFNVSIDYFFERTNEKEIIVNTKEVNSVFYEKFIRLCEDNNTKPSPVLAELGLSSGNLKRWENSSSITLETLEKISSYFGVPLDYFSECPDRGVKYLKSREEKMLKYFNELSDEEQCEIVGQVKYMASVQKESEKEKIQ